MTKDAETSSPAITCPATMALERAAGSFLEMAMPFDKSSSCSTSTSLQAMLSQTHLKDPKTQAAGELSLQFPSIGWSFYDRGENDDGTVEDSLTHALAILHGEDKKSSSCYQPPSKRRRVEKQGMVRSKAFSSLTTSTANHGGLLYV